METNDQQQVQHPPSSVEQREVITSLERDGESLHAYFVSTSWYNCWKSYVGLNKSKDKDKKTSAKPQAGNAQQEVVSSDRKSCDQSKEVALSSREKRRRKHRNSQDSSGELNDLEKVSQSSEGQSNLSSSKPTANTVLNDSGSGHVTSSANPGPSSDHMTSLTNPGPVSMDCDENENNILIDEKIWLRWIEWYGVTATHQLDRRSWSSQEKEFEICIFSPYSCIVENPTKVLDLTEKVGYIEVQLRKIFNVHQHKRTRMWLCEKARQARFRLVPNRDNVLEKTGPNGAKLNLERDHIIAIEVCNPNNSWPSCVPGESKGDLKELMTLTQGRIPEDYWVEELCQTVDSVFCGISGEMRETVDGIVQTAKCVTGLRENELQEIKKSLHKKEYETSELEKYLDEKSSDMLLEERNLKQAVAVVKQERQFLDDERNRFNQELNEMKELNRITESRVKLDIGGHIYTTSVLTLTKDPSSMLAAMFSGRHSLVKEKDGSYFLDRDGTHFRYILNYLRDGGFREGALPQDRGMLMELLTEAEYYQITGLIKCLQDHMDTLPVAVRSSFSEVDREDSSGDEDSNGVAKKPLRRVVYRRQITPAT